MNNQKDIKNILMVLNSTQGLFKYPIGNKELMEKVKTLEALGRIKYDAINNRWVKK